MVSDGVADEAHRMRCHAFMASGFHDYNLKTNYQKGGRSSSRSAGLRGSRFGGCKSIFEFKSLIS